MPNQNTVYKAPAASNLANPTSASVFVRKDQSTKAAAVELKYDGTSATQAFRVRARGKATTGGSITWLAKLQFVTDVTPSGQVTAATAGNNTDLFSLTARSISTATRYWEIDVKLYWDPTSQRLTGQSNGYNNETIETANAAISALTAVDLTTNKCGIVVAGIFGSSNASNVGVLDELSVEVL